MINLPHTFGDYTVTNLLYQQDDVVFFTGIQTRMARPVTLAILRPERKKQEEIDNFLSGAKAKAQTQYPLLAAVFEASSSEGKWYYAQETIPCENLEQRAAAGNLLSVPQTISLIRHIGKCFIYFSENNIASDPLLLKNIYLNTAENDDIRIDNVANHKLRSPDELDQQMVNLATLFYPILPMNEAGATRVRTLSTWMIEGLKDKRLIWDQVFDMLDLIEEQLGFSDAKTTALMKSRMIIHNQVLCFPVWVWAACILLLLGLGATAYSLMNTEASPPPIAKKNLYPKAKFSNGDIHMTEIYISKDKKFLVSSHEVTIDAYARFLNVIENLPPSRASRFNHPDQPASKTSHQPGDWKSMYAAAEKGDTWHGMKLSLRHPVMNVDWWSAYAFAQYKEGRLPSLEEWNAIEKVSNSTHLGDPLCAVDDYKQDVNSNGIAGMLSGVQEWTSTQQIDPLHPMEPKGWVIIGGDAHKPSKEIRYERNPSTQLPNIGFRIIKPMPNKKS